jgi:hypothetical protein
MPSNQHGPSPRITRADAVILAFKGHTPPAPPSGCARCGISDGCNCSEIDRRRFANEHLVAAFTQGNTARRRVCH